MRNVPPLAGCTLQSCILTNTLLELISICTDKDDARPMRARVRVRACVRARVCRCECVRAWLPSFGDTMSVGAGSCALLDDDDVALNRRVGLGESPITGCTQPAGDSAT